MTEPLEPMGDEPTREESPGVEPLAQEPAAPLPPKPIRKRDFAVAAWRLLQIQTIMAPERMQGPGFAFAMAPILRRLYPDRARLGEALERHTAYVATHPLLSGYVLGAAVGLEQERAAGKPIDGARIDAIKRALASPLAAMGDPFFWVVLRPFAGLLAVCSIAWFGPPDPSLPDLRVLLCPLVLLLTYNAVALPTRWRGVATGYAAADRPADLLRSLRFGEWREIFERAGAFFYGTLLAMIGVGIRASAGPAAGLGGLAAALVPLAVGFGGARLLLRRSPASTVGTALLLAALAMLASLTL